MGGTKRRRKHGNKKNQVGVKREYKTAHEGVQLRGKRAPQPLLLQSSVKGTIGRKKTWKERILGGVLVPLHRSAPQFRPGSAPPGLRIKSDVSERKSPEKRGNRIGRLHTETVKTVYGATFWCKKGRKRRERKKGWNSEMISGSARGRKRQVAWGKDRDITG